jgi:hypothetical protein
MFWPDNAEAKTPAKSKQKSRPVMGDLQVFSQYTAEIRRAGNAPNRNYS